MQIIVISNNFGLLYYKGGHFKFDEWKIELGWKLFSTFFSKIFSKSFLEGNYISVESLHSLPLYNFFFCFHRFLKKSSFGTIFANQLRNFSELDYCANIFISILHCQFMGNLKRREDSIPWQGRIIKDKFTNIVTPTFFEWVTRDFFLSVSDMRCQRLIWNLKMWSVLYVGRSNSTDRHA